MDVTATLHSVSDPEAGPQVPAEQEDKRLPEKVRLWGFVRRTANDKDDNAVLRDTDVGLWLDEPRCRFLVAAGQAVKDDLAPLEFIQFIRELKHSHSQTLFKLGSTFERSPRRATPVWSRPMAIVITFPTKLRLHVAAAARSERNSASPAIVMPAARRSSASSSLRRGASAAGARFS